MSWDFIHFGPRVAIRRIRLRQAERQIFSQNGEDGLLRCVFANIGVWGRSFVEIGCGDGNECNTANLARRHHWSGLLIDGDAGNAAVAQKHYQQRHLPVVVRQAFITAENVNNVIKPEVAGMIDLLSIDIDGVDYWVWQALAAVEPRVVIIEYNASLGPHRSAVVRYDPAFERFYYHPSGYYHGASLTALTKLAHHKGYALVGCDQVGVNAIFVKHSELSGRLLPLTPAQAYYPCRIRVDGEMSNQAQYDLTAAMDFIEV